MATIRPAKSFQTGQRSRAAGSRLWDSEGRRIWIADAHRDDGKRFVARADEKLTAFVELQAAIRGVSGEALYENQATPDYTRLHGFL